ncbi:MAG: class I SAM-dependent methyltransferase [Solirubrobacterales bacterium]
MALGMAAWLTAGRLRARRGLDLDFPRRRRDTVRRLAPGRSFIDVGGLWNVHGETAFEAEEAGASKVTVLDAMEPTREFEEEHARRRSAVEFVRADLHDAEAIAALGSFDVVWCTGVVYHSPSPFEQLEHLRRICDGELYLGSHVIPEVPGIEQACIWYPGLSEGGRSAFTRAHGGDRAPVCLGVTRPFNPGERYGNWWWGISPSALVAMTEAAGFEVGDRHHWTAFLIDLLARPT